MPDVNPILKLIPDTYNDKGFSSITDLSRASQSEAAWLSPYVTHISFAMGGSYSRINFPMLAMTEGNIRNTSAVKKIDNFEFKYPILGRMKKTSTIAKTIYTSTDKPGVGGSTFKVYFTDRWFSNGQTVYAPSEQSCRVQGDPVKVGDSYAYNMTMWGSSQSAFMPLTDLQQGINWSGGVHKVGFEDSRGTESRDYLGGVATNMTSLVRKTYKLKGNVGEKIMKYQIKADGKVFEGYVDWQIFLCDMQFKEDCEADLWYSVYDKNSDGEIVMIDSETSIPVTSGAGIDQQITNTDTYSYLTYNKFANTISDVFFNIAGADAPVIDVWTGTGGKREFDRAMKDDLKAFTVFVDSKQFAEGGPNTNNMVYGSYFGSFRHVDGYVVNLRYHPMFDRGHRADIAPLKPGTNLPLTSFDFYFIDSSTYEGVPNVQYIQEKGREMETWTVAGAKVPKGFPDTGMRATDRDASSVQFMKSQAVQIKNPVACFKLKCVIG